MPKHAATTRSRTPASDAGRSPAFRGLFLAAPLLFAAVALAGPKRDRVEAEPPDVPVAPAPASAREPQIGSLFPDAVPVAPQPLPSGLANLSAQGCNACHASAHDAWAESPHALGASSQHFRDAIAAAATPACTVCHLPLTQQQPDLVTYDGGDPNRPVRTPNPDYDATLAAEGVTCAACHVRDGRIVAARAGAGPSPHPLAWAPELGASDGCAACHQLAWPGNDKPLYDTYGEWQRSPQGRAGITCLDCHVTGSAGAPDHAMTADVARAISVLLALPPTLDSGETTVGRVRVQNTGAGHHFPTGSPWVGMRVEAALIGPPGRDGKPTVRAATAWDLARTLERAPPWHTVSDTRIAAGTEAAWDWTIGPDADAAPGPWIARLTVRRVVSGTPQDPPILTRDTLVRVE